jgi:DNA-binding NarL/FixJ family response regulator
VGNVAHNDIHTFGRPFQNFDFSWTVAMATCRSSRTITIVLLAENRLLREALTKILNKKSGIRVLAAFSFSPQAVKQLAEAQPQVLLVDSDTFESSNGQVIRDLHEEFPTAKVVMVGMDPDREKFLSVVRSGAVGYVLKDASAVEVEVAVRSVAKEEAACPPKLCLALFDYLARQTSQIPGFYGKLQFGLTNREQQLIMMMGRGLRNKEIANELNLSDQTVKHHVHHVLRKVGAADRLALVELCRLHGMSV